jgi:hypothetical protein
MEVSGELHIPAALSQGRSHVYPADRRVHRPQSRSGHGGGEENSQHLPGFEPPIIQPVAQSCTTELSRLLCHLIYGRHPYSISLLGTLTEVSYFSLVPLAIALQNMPPKISPLSTILRIDKKM